MVLPTYTIVTSFRNKYQNKARANAIIAAINVDKDLEAFHLDLATKTDSTATDGVDPTKVVRTITIKPMADYFNYFASVAAQKQAMAQAKIVARAVEARAVVEIASADVVT